MTAPLTLEDVLAWLDGHARAKCGAPETVLLTADAGHLVMFVGGGTVLLLGPHAGTAIETGDIRTVLETAKERGLLPVPEPKRRRFDDEPTPPADVLRDWCKVILANEAPNALLAPEKSGVGVLRSESGMPTWAVFVSRTLEYGETSVDVAVVNIENAPDCGPDLALGGSLQWDGCFNLDDRDSSEEMWFSPTHFCGPDGVHGLETRALLMRSAWALAHPMFDRPCFERPHVPELEIVLAPPTWKEET